MEREGTTDASLKIEGEDRRMYDVALNIERLSVETCVNTVVKLAESRRLPDRATMRSALSDKLIEVRIKSAFAEHISLSMACRVAGGCGRARRRQRSPRPHCAAIFNRSTTVPQRNAVERPNFRRKVRAE